MTGRRGRVRCDEEVLKLKTEMFVAEEKEKVKSRSISQILRLSPPKNRHSRAHPVCSRSIIPAHFQIITVTFPFIRRTAQIFLNNGTARAERTSDFWKHRTSVPFSTREVSCNRLCRGQVTCSSSHLPTHQPGTNPFCPFFPENKKIT